MILKIKNFASLGLILLSLFSSSYSLAQNKTIGSETNSSSEKLEDKKEKELSEAINLTVEPIEFDRIRKVLEKDRLGEEALKKKNKIVKKKKSISEKLIAQYDLPKEEDFWSFFSEYWIVKNVTILKWNFQKPEYGLEDSFKEFLEQMGILELKFKILLVNTPDVTHFALPSNSDEVIFLLSVPFIRTLDLSKLEISILLLEDYVRLQKGFFKDFAKVKGLDQVIGSNFHGKSWDKKILNKISEKYDELIFDKGFSFQQQFAVTERMNAMLKNKSKWWNGYYLMLGKIDNLVKSNILYQKYLKIYPSPELQRNWLRPKNKKVL